MVGYVGVVVVVDVVQEFVQVGDCCLGFQYCLDFVIQIFGGLVQVYFQDLVDVYM